MAAILAQRVELPFPQVVQNELLELHRAGGRRAEILAPCVDDAQPADLPRVEYVERDRRDAPTPVLGVRAPGVEEGGQRSAVSVRCREALREDHRASLAFRMADNPGEEHRTEHETGDAADTTSTHDSSSTHGCSSTLTGARDTWRRARPSSVSVGVDAVVRDG